MSLHSGLDTVSIISFGLWSKTYGFGEEGNLANLAVSFGYLEDAPDVAVVVATDFEFQDGQLINRLSFTEDKVVQYFNSEEVYLVRIAWTEDFEVQDGSGNVIVRQPFSEDYLFDGVNIRRIAFTGDYESDDLLFIKQPFSENYKVEAK